MKNIILSLLLITSTTATLLQGAAEDTPFYLGNLLCEAAKEGDHKLGSVDMLSHP